MERERLYYNDNTILCPLQCQQTIRIRNNLCGNCGSKYQHIVSLKKLSLKVNFAPTLINYFLKYSLSQKVDYNLGNIYSSWKVAQMNLTSLRSNPLYATANLVTNTVVVGENLNLNTLILRYFSHYCFFV